MNDDSKIERGGSLSLVPGGYFEGDTKTPMLNVDASFMLNEDVQNVGAKGQEGGVLPYMD